MSAKVALVTGANTGIGRVTARELALQGAHVFLACRSLQKTQPVLDEIAEQSGGKAKVSFLPLDLADLDSVRKCAQGFLEQGLPLHLLICNAGLAGAKGKTASGFELTFGTCHVGHFLLTQLLLDSIKRAAPARIVVVASKMHTGVNTIDFDAVRKPTRSFGALKEYSVAKLANILFAKQLARQLEGTGVNTYALHPGVVATDVWRFLPWPLDKWIKRSMLTPEEGAATSLYCATSDEVSEQSGLYYKKCQVIEPSAAAQDPALAKQLWDASQRWVQSG
ncbi:SDR family oxidoreductase [Ketobacter sp.]